MFSHTMDVHNGKYSYIQETSREACEKIHIMGYLQMGHIHIIGHKPNQTLEQSS